MNKQNGAFLLGGLAFGMLIGYGVFQAVHDRPRLDALGQAGAANSGPAGPRAPGQVGPSGNAGGAPMMAELNALKRNLQANPEDLDALVRLARIYHDVSMWEPAIGYYERAIALKPDDPDLITDMGICYRGTGGFEKALELFDRAQEIDSGHWQSLFNTVVVAGFDLGKFDRALSALEAMEAMNPPPPRIAELRQALEQAREAAASSG